MQRKFLPLFKIALVLVQVDPMLYQSIFHIFPANLEPEFTHYLCEQRKEMEFMKTRKRYVLSKSSATFTQSGLLAVLLERQRDKAMELAEHRAHRRQIRSAFSNALTWLLARARSANSGRSLQRVFHKPGTVFHQIHTYTELRQQIHDDLRLQHPDWVQSNGESPICDSYEARLLEFIGPLMGTGVEPVQKSPIV